MRFGVTTAFLFSAVFGSALIAFGNSESSVSAAALTTGSINARVSDHIGVDVNGNPVGDATSNCVLYKPTDTASSSAWVTSPNEAITAHGKEDSKCPSSLKTSEQSAVGVRPAAETSFVSGVPFLLGRMIHYNNPIVSVPEYWTGNLEIKMEGFDGTPIVKLPWWMWETPNQADPCPNGSNKYGCFDEIKFTSLIGEQIVTQNGLDFRLLVNGFVPVDSETDCPSSTDAEIETDFWTTEKASTHACLYAELSQVRELTITKSIEGNSEVVNAPSATFDFTTTGSLKESNWTDGSFSLTPASDSSESATPREILKGDTVSIKETAPESSNWALDSISCTDFDSNGNSRPLPEASYDVELGVVTLTKVGTPDFNSNPDISCVFTNTYTPTATTTTLPAATTTTTIPAVSTTLPASTTTPPATTTTTIPRVPAEVTVAPTTTTPVVLPLGLPATGRDTDWTTIVSLMLLFVGAGALIWRRALS